LRLWREFLKSVESLAFLLIFYAGHRPLFALLDYTEPAADCARVSNTTAPSRSSEKGNSRAASNADSLTQASSPVFMPQQSKTMR
jgi:hypothetical protein